MIRKNITYTLAAVLLMMSCEKTLDKQPLDSLGNTTYWTTTADAERTVNDIYRFLGSDERFFMSCATDDSYSWSNWPVDIQFAANGSATPNTDVFLKNWRYMYQMIAKANDVLDNIDRVPNMDAAVKAELTGEARFLRAFAYQQLAGLYGDVVLYTTTPTPEDFQVAKTPKSEIVAFVVSELTEIADSLPTTRESAKQGRATRGAALALKARTLLYNAQWAEAAEAAQQVMDLGVYTIDNNYLSLFNGTNENSTEIILSARYLENVYTNPNATWIGGPSLAGWGQIVPLRSLVDAYECVDGLTIDESPLYNPATPFENRDPRLALTIVTPGTVVNGVTIDVTNPNSPDALGKSNASFSGYYYKKAVPANISGEWDRSAGADVMILRYAEVLLTYAEAKIEAGQIDASVYAAINQVRQRNGVNMIAATAVTHPDQQSLRALVRRERHVEFPVEDNRLFDIRRWEIAETVMQGVAQGIFNNFDATRGDFNNYITVERRTFNAGRDYLWPIPANELNLNKLLTQNNGW
ncbi:RagB/SusD family nutrient uptake outer membrane protein [Sphingobacterium chungjuense]|uniref:RagB/SusD family nutrient uptake outer membrane protein n=1 Tax=Sphingobacterium chungjuense TaxID=2675553 RepID=UPI001409EC28|nr:RagB/SusD family nutrient uptake outer membrane protein [Sphingobacterium chungjuense]